MILDARLFPFLRRASFSFSPQWLFCEKLGSCPPLQLKKELVMS